MRRWQGDHATRSGKAAPARKASIFDITRRPIAMRVSCVAEPICGSRTVRGALSQRGLSAGSPAKTSSPTAPTRPSSSASINASSSIRSPRGGVDDDGAGLERRDRRRVEDASRLWSSPGHVQGQHIGLGEKHGTIRDIAGAGLILMSRAPVIDDIHASQTPRRVQRWHGRCGRSPRCRRASARARSWPRISAGVQLDQAPARAAAVPPRLRPRRADRISSMAMSAVAGSQDIRGVADDQLHAPQRRPSRYGRCRAPKLAISRTEVGKAWISARSTATPTAGTMIRATFDRREMKSSSRLAALSGSDLGLHKDRRTGRLLTSGGRLAANDDIGRGHWLGRQCRERSLELGIDPGAAAGDRPGATAISGI